ncbi:peroxiredoxin [Roseomonas sp. SSH11]|uniref:Alkyl hydroperoxide reductase C n=1 Tax=Pararoseomonas baculiformis TaxID=2820812 RepID=A0ABS4AH62_9PROT|nr:peroxiredoxin [Pararoseomonas baculiformis]MBP0446209.1 peroxiredoxin [Pararoseomonas baculiformis]
MLTIGDQFPTFRLTGVVGGPKGLDPKTAFTTVTDADDPALWKVVFFWPKDFTVLCPTEITSFGRLTDDFQARNAALYGVSVESELAHMNWRIHHADLRDLPFVMLSDIRRELSQACGILDRNEGVPMRATFILDPDGIIRFVSVNDFSVGRNPQEVLRVLDALQSGEICPSEWRKGDPVLSA